jgi:hypothetical protein
MAAARKGGRHRCSRRTRVSANGAVLVLQPHGAGPFVAQMSEGEFKPDYFPFPSFVLGPFPSGDQVGFEFVQLEDHARFDVDGRGLPEGSGQQFCLEQDLVALLSSGVIELIHSRSPASSWFSWSSVRSSCLGSKHSCSRLRPVNPYPTWRACSM